MIKYNGRFFSKFLKGTNDRENYRFKRKYLAESDYKIGAMNKRKKSKLIIGKERFNEIKESGVSSYVREFTNTLIHNTIKSKEEVLKGKTDGKQLSDSHIYENFGDGQRKTNIAEERKAKLREMKSKRGKKVNTGIRLSAQAKLVNSVFKSLNSRPALSAHSTSRISLLRKADENNRVSNGFVIGNMHYKRDGLKSVPSEYFHTLEAKEEFIYMKDGKKDMDSSFKSKRFHHKREKSEGVLNSYKNNLGSTEFTWKKNDKSKHLRNTNSFRIKNRSSIGDREDLRLSYHKSLDTLENIAFEPGLFKVRPVKGFDRKYKFSGNTPSVVELDNTKVFFVSQIVNL